MDDFSLSDELEILFWAKLDFENEQKEFLSLPLKSKKKLNKKKLLTAFSEFTTDVNLPDNAYQKLISVLSLTLPDVNLNFLNNNIKETKLDYLTFEYCPCKQLVYVGCNRYEDKCNVCTEKCSRYRLSSIDRAHERTPQKTISYRPLSTILYRLLQTETFLKLINWIPIDDQSGLEGVGVIADICSTDLSKKHLQEMQIIASGENFKDHISVNLLISFAYDGADVHKRQKTHFWPMIITFLNLPPSHRFKRDVGMFLLSLLPVAPGMKLYTIKIF
jgi:CRISPR/Cas system CMR subunit Cmr4 (Cas7 group RAMP superfamily)